MDDLYARFNPNPNKIAAWRRLLMLDQKCSLSPSYMPRHSSPSPVAKPSEKEACSPDVLYNRAIPTLLRYRDELVKGGWRLWPEDQLAQGLLFMVEYTGNDLPLRHTAVDHHSYPLLDSEELFPLESPVVSTPSSSHSSSSLSSFSSGSSSVLHSEDESSHASSAQSILFGLPSDLSGFLEHREAIEDTMRNRRLFKPVLDTKGDIVLSTTFDAIPRELGNRTDDISQTLSRNQPLADIFYLLQLIVPGMFLLVQDSLSIVSKGKPLHICLEPPGTAGSIHWEERTRPMGSNDSFRGSRRSSRRTTKDSSIESRSTARVYLRRTRRALPPADWITSRTETMEKIFGKHLLQDLLNCARDVELTVWRTEHGPPEEDYVGSLGGVGSVECFDMESDTGFGSVFDHQPPTSPSCWWPYSSPSASTADIDLKYAHGPLAKDATLPRPIPTLSSTSKLRSKDDLYLSSLPRPRSL